MADAEHIDLVSRARAAKILGCSTSWLAKGNGPAPLPDLPGPKYSLAVIEQWIEERRRIAIACSTFEAPSSGPASSTAESDTTSAPASAVSVQIPERITKLVAEQQKKRAASALRSSRARVRKGKQGGHAA